MIPTMILRELKAPAGWTAAVLEAPLPLADDERGPYQQAVQDLVARIPAFVEPYPEELFLIFEYCRPAVEIPLLQDNARWRQPQFGLGIWLDSEPPTTWTAEEFTTAAPGTLRPVVDRVVRLSRDPEAQRDAWQTLLGSGALLRVSTTAPDRFVREATDYLQPTIADRSLTSFPFYVPLLTEASLLHPSLAYRAPLADLLPQTRAYLRESVTDGGFLLAVQQPPAVFWKALLQRTPSTFQVARNTIIEGDV